MAAVIPPESHPPIVYPMALVGQYPRSDATGFFTFLTQTPQVAVKHLKVGIARCFDTVIRNMNCKGGWCSFLRIKYRPNPECPFFECVVVRDFQCCQFVCNS